jgi:aryl-alcohol dehydrogenase-like predicted oxidoreductase
MPLDTYYTLGRSGLRVSRLALGTMTFGQPGWGCDRETALALFDRYRYAVGGSEELVGEFLADRGVRDRIVLSTKFSLGSEAGNPNSSGNGRKSMVRALENSLRRLRTDYVDLYFLHAWDGMTPVEEVMRGLDDLVTQGKVRYAAFSDVPAWYAARGQTLAEWRGYEPLCALQLEYSLAERGIEYEFPGLCHELGLGLMVWGPLANGLLSGKYARDAELPDGRLKIAAPHTPPELDKLTQRNWAIVSELAEVARDLGRTSAQVAINWAANRPAVGAVLLGATKSAQLEDTLQSLDFELPEALGSRLDEVSEPPLVKPYGWFGWGQSLMNEAVAAKPPHY